MKPPAFIKDSFVYLRRSVLRGGRYAYKEWQILRHKWWVKALLLLVVFWWIFLKGTPNEVYPESLLATTLDPAHYNGDVQGLHDNLNSLYPRRKNGDQLVTFLQENWTEMESVSGGFYGKTNRDVTKMIEKTRQADYTPERESYTVIGMIGFHLLYNVLSVLFYKDGLQADGWEIYPYAFQGVTSYRFYRIEAAAQGGFQNLWVIHVNQASNGDVVTVDAYRGYDLQAERFAERGVPFNPRDFVSFENAEIALTNYVETHGVRHLVTQSLFQDNIYYIEWHYLSENLRNAGLTLYFYRKNLQSDSNKANLNNVFFNYRKNLRTIDNPKVEMGSTFDAYAPKFRINRSKIEYPKRFWKDKLYMTGFPEEEREEYFTYLNQLQKEKNNGRNQN